MLGMHFHFLVKRHSDPRKDQEGPEQVDDPMERLQQDNPQRSHHAAQYEGTQDAPEEHPVLIGRWHLEEGEEQHKDENVIHAERLFDQVAREELQGGFSTSEKVQSGV